MLAKLILLLTISIAPFSVVAARPFDELEPAQTGDTMMETYLARGAIALDAGFLDGMKTAEDWRRAQTRLRDEYHYMLGLSPTPARTPLKATVTGAIEGNGFVVENLHYQSMPGLYVTANLYRPAKAADGVRLPAVLYVCGHSGMGRDGGKTAFQSHGIWFARHGYVCLIVDTLQLGEIPGVHHGTYREGRWWWHSRGYTPAGVECWNGVRGIDYLVSRADVDPDRIGVTGISGGGAATFWIAAADDRVKVAVPVSGMADLASYVSNRVVNGHCDCMFLYNTFEWPWTQIAALVAPRPLLFVNSDNDGIFPMDANQRVTARLESLYSLYGAGDRVDAVVSVGGHDYREDIRRSAYRFLNTQLKGDPRPVTDSEANLVEEKSNPKRYPIEPSRLRVFKTDADLPADRRNSRIDRDFVPLATSTLPEKDGFDAWKARLLAELRRVTFRPLPARIPPARAVGNASDEFVRVETENGIVVSLQLPYERRPVAEVKRVLLAVVGDKTEKVSDDWSKEVRKDGDALYRLEPRGVGPTRWTRTNPPNYVERAHVLLGRTVDGGRVRDIAATARYLRAKYGEKVPVVVVGEGSAGILGAYAALLEPEIGGVVAINPPDSHMDATAPQLLNVLRVLDIPEALGMLAPGPLVIVRGSRELRERVGSLYETAGASKQFESR
ncbi:MAG: Acetyl xylan esterase [Planctomycetota bacterium]|nr:Acetyl xylan esterase [Planctomycetota bacterium]